MPTQRAFPYTYLEHELGLDVFGLELDGEDQSAYINAEQMTAHAQALDWSCGKLHVRAVIPEGAREALLPEAERESPNWHVLLSASCRSSRWRQGFVLKPTKDDRIWEGAVPLQRRLLHDNVKLTSYLVRTALLEDAPTGYGSSKNVRLASSHEWTLQVDDPQVPPGGFLDTKWEHFSESDHPLLRRNKDLVFYLDVAQQEQPVLYLNSGHETLEVVLESRATSGLSAAVRDIISNAVAQNVWITLAMTSLLSAHDDSGEPIELDGWRANVYARIERQLRQEANIDVEETTRDPESAPVLMEALSATVQRMAGTTKSTLKILKEADR